MTVFLIAYLVFPSAWEIIQFLLMPLADKVRSSDVFPLFVQGTLQLTFPSIDTDLDRGSDRGGAQ